jgi:glycosyltransferase involved in cell wall biosynthesis
MASVTAVHVVGNSVVGGTERHVLDLVTGLRDAGYDVAVVCPRPGPLPDALAVAGVPVHLIEFVHPRPGDEYAFDPRAAARLERLIRELRPAVVHSHLYRAHLHATIAGAEAGVPALLTTAHTLVVRSADAWLTRATQVHTIACSDHVAQRLRKAGIPAGRITVVRNGIGGDHLAPVPAGNRAGILAVARLSPEKGLDVLLHAARIVAGHQSSVTFAIAGAGPQERWLRRLRDQLDLGRTVRFLGERHDVATLLRSAAIFASPSTREAGPLAVLEAMAAGTAVAAAAAGGTPEAVTDGATGLLAEPGNPRSLAAALLRLQASPSLRARLGSAARQAVLRGHTLDQQIRRTRQVYEQMLSGKRPGCRAGPTADYTAW